MQNVCYVWLFYAFLPVLNVFVFVRAICHGALKLDHVCFVCNICFFQHFFNLYNSSMCEIYLNINIINSSYNFLLSRH